MFRKKIVYLVFAVSIFLLNVASIEAKPIKVVASTLDMADFTKQIGGNRVELYAISKGQFDLHFFRPKPAQVTKLRNADMLVVGGLGVDPWITGLIDASRNPKINYGGVGFVDPSKGVKALDIPSGQISGAMGDVHPYGNPHFWYNPDNIVIAVDNIMKGLVRLSPKDEDYFKKNRNAYIQKVRDTFHRLDKQMIPFAGTKVFQFHSSWNYFCNHFGLRLVGAVEPKPGLPPTPSHLKKLVKDIEQKNVKLILVEPYYSGKPLRFLTQQTDVKVLRLPFYLGGKPEIKTFLANLEYIVNQITNALEG